ncbi:MAG: DUF3182 family protein [Burkholderiaceae bacterium]|jgi:hypothetical protein|nr:DUF3182 family protein [Burkholderiaceae bacterium]
MSEAVVGGAPLTRHSRVSFLCCRPGAREHELVSQIGIARELARLIGGRFDRYVDAERTDAEAALGYVVPNDTIVGVRSALRWGIESEDDLFGGVVPFPFVATKVISHPLVAADAPRPPGWEADFAARIADVVLPGYSVFSIRDLQVAAGALLSHGPVRMKLASGIGGLGQSVVGSERELAERLSHLDPSEVVRRGAVVETDLRQARTWSIGQLRIGRLRTSYFGTQRTTRDCHGDEVYGGSSITMVRGGFDSLEPHVMGDEPLRRALGFARVYHEAAFASFAGIFASRCNYDVVQGVDVDGVERTGVLEQSWRVGGASPAELVALHALRDDPAREKASAEAVELHCADPELPEGAFVHFRGVDDRVGPITKYARLLDDADA